MVIWVASYPRSGSSFLRLLLREFYGFPNHSIYREAYSRYVDQSILLDLAKAQKPHFVKTHELPQEDDFPAIYLVRDGQDVLVSYAWYILSEQEADTTADSDLFKNTLRSLIVSNEFFGGWGPNVLAWTRRTAPTVVVKFEEFVHDPLGTVDQSLIALGHEPVRVRKGDPPTFEFMHRKVPRLYRKGQIGGWRDEMPQDLHELFWERHGQAMAETGYTR